MNWQLILVYCNMYNPRSKEQTINESMKENIMPYFYLNNWIYPTTQRPTDYYKFGITKNYANRTADFMTDKKTRKFRNETFSVRTTLKSVFILEHEERKVLQEIETALKRVVNRVPEFGVVPGFTELVKLPVSAGLELLEQKVEAICSMYEFTGIKVYSAKHTPKQMLAFDESWKDVLREKEADGFVKSAKYYLN